MHRKGYTTTVASECFVVFRDAVSRVISPVYPTLSGAVAAGQGFRARFPTTDLFARWRAAGYWAPVAPGCPMSLVCRPSTRRNFPGLASRKRRPSRPAAGPFRYSPFRGALRALRSSTALIGVLALSACQGRARLVVAVEDDAQALEKVRIFLDGREMCTLSPCELEVEAGEHTLAVRADGYEPLEDAQLTLQAGQDQLHRVLLKPSTPHD